MMLMMTSPPKATLKTFCYTNPDAKLRSRSTLSVREKSLQPPSNWSADLNDIYIRSIKVWRPAGGVSMSAWSPPTGWLGVTTACGLNDQYGPCFGTSSTAFLFF